MRFRDPDDAAHEAAIDDDITRPSAPLDPFVDEGWITRALREVKSGKEASVWLCEGGGRAGDRLVAVKLYRAAANRGFANDAVYWDGGMRSMSRRVRTAATRRTGFGRDVRFAAWVGREFDQLERLHAAGCRVPRAIARAGEGLALEWIASPGDAEEAAPQLRHADLSPAESQVAFDQLMESVERFLAHDVVHADLSEYNVLWDGGRAVVIDFPQAVDPRFNRSARDLLARDVGNLARFFARHGVLSNPDTIVRDLWHRWQRAQL